MPPKRVTAGPPARAAAATRRTARRAPAAGATGTRVKNATLYEGGATQTRRTLRWQAPTALPNTAILYNLTTLRDRSRNATRNDGYAKGAIEKLVANLIGTGIKPLSQAPDDLMVDLPDGRRVPFRQAVHELWTQWTDESDADGLLDFYGQQTQAVRAWLEGGEVFVRQRPRLASDGLSVPLQLQVIEPELCPHTHNLTLPNRNRVRAGIEFTPIGRRVAYWFYQSRPGDLEDADFSQLRRIPADLVRHMFNPLRPGQLRGVPHLTQALIKLYELDKYDDATLLRQQLGNLFAMFVTRPASLSDESVHPLTGEAVETLNDQPLVQLNPGIVQELAPGEEVEFSDPPEVGNGYKEFTKQQLHHIATAADVPYETLTGDMSGVNDRTVRVILNEFRRHVQAWQHQIIAFQFCRPVWRAWMDRVFLSGALPIPVSYVENPEPWLRVKWMPQGWPYLHPVQDVQAKREAVRAGFSSRSAEVSELGEDAEVIDAEQAADNARADRLELQYDSDARQAVAAATPPTPPADPPDEAPDQAPAKPV